MALFSLSTAARGRLAGRTSLALGLWLLLVATNPGRMETLDVSARLAVTRQLWTTGSVVVHDQPKGSESVWIEIAPGRYVAPYGIGQSLAFVPFDMVSAVLERFSPEAWRAQLSWLPIGLGLVPLLGLAYWHALRKLLQEWGVARPWPTLGSLAMMLGTVMFFYAGQAQEESLVGLCVALTTLFALRLRRRRTWKNALAAGLFAGACLTIRPVSVFALLMAPVLILTLKESWASRLRYLAVAGAAAAAVASVVAWYNFARFGSPFTIGYDRMGHLSMFAFDARSPRVLAALLIGPGGGLLVLSPVIAIAVHGMRRLWELDRPYVVGMLIALTSCYAFFSGWHDSYTGGSTWGTRYQVHLLALLAIPVTLGLHRLALTARGRVLALGIVALSVGIQGMSVVATHHIEPFQRACDGKSELDFLSSPVRGQLERRAQNVVQWAAGAPPPTLPDPACQSVMNTMWERYIPNFWGPVYAHRLAGSGTWVLAGWSILFVSASWAIGVGLRQELRAHHVGG